MVASYNQSHMSDSSPTDKEIPTRPQEMRAVRLIGFSVRDRELLRLFLRRPPRAGVSLTVVEEDADDEVDLLIANVATDEARDALRHWRGPRPAIGIVERFESDAKYYQIAQDGQMLFSLAQAINRIRSGWTPPVPVSATSEMPSVADAIPSDSVAGQSQRVAAISIEAARSPALKVAERPSLGGTGASVPSTPPVAAVPDASQPHAMGVSGLPWQRALDILVIDDSHFSREAISAALVKVGFLVDTAEDGASGILRATEKRYDVALVDFEMPNMQGPEVLRKLRALGLKSPTLLIMLTSRTGAVDRLRAKFAGCDAYLTKPTRMQEFLKILREFAVAGKLTRS